MLHVNTGGVYFTMRDTAKAVAAYRKAIAVAPNDPKPHSALGFVMAEAGSLDVAISELDRAVALKADDPETRKSLGDLYLARGEADSAIAYYRSVLALDPDAVQVRQRVGSIYAEKGDFDSAVAEYRRCIRDAPKWALPYSNLASVYLQRGTADSAIAAYRRCIALMPEDAALQNNLGYAYARHGLIDSAIAAYQRAIRFSPDPRMLRDAQNNLIIMQAIRAGKMRVRHILLRTEAEAQEILKQLKDGADFAELARRRSADPSAEEGGITGFFSAGDLDPDFESAVKQLKVGEMSGVVKTRLGYHVILRLN